MALRGGRPSIIRAFGLHATCGSYSVDPDNNVEAEELEEMINTNVDIGYREAVMQSLVTPLCSRNTEGLLIIHILRISYTLLCFSIFEDF